MWFWYVILSALASGVSVILNKKALNKINPALVSWSLFVFSIPLLVYPALKDGIPKVNGIFWIASIASVLVYGFGKTLSLKSLKSNLMSEIIPLSLFGVLIQYILGLILFSEKLNAISIFGLLLIVVGGYFLKIEEAKEDFFRPFKLLFTDWGARMYLIAFSLMVLASAIDKVSLNHMINVNQSFYLLLTNVLTSILIGVYIQKDDRNWVHDLKNNFWILFFGGIMFYLVSIFYLYGITEGPLALVSGVKKLEVFFVLIFGWLLFKDKPKKGVWIGGLIMLLGVVLIKIG